MPVRPAPASLTSTQANAAAAADPSSRRRRRSSGARASRRGVAPRPHFRVEGLEERRLFATLVGTDADPALLEFLDARGNINRVRTFGNITLELIAAVVDDNNNVDLITAIPANTDEGPINGGLQPPSGLDRIGTVTIPGHTADQVNIQQLAANAAGDLYAFNINVITIQDPNGMDVDITRLELIQINPNTAAGTVVADITDQVLAAAGGSFDGGAPAVQGVSAADFSPATGDLAFVVQGGDSSIDRLFLIDTDPSTADADGDGDPDGDFDGDGDVDGADIPASVNVRPGTFGDGPGNNNTTVTSIAFDEVAANGVSRLVAAISRGAGMNVQTQVGAVNVNNTNLGTFTDAGGAEPITGIEVLSENAGGADTSFLGLRAAMGGADVVRINAATGQVTTFGPLAGPDDGDTGMDPQGMAFVPGLTDPFGGGPGAFIGVDGTTDEIFFVARNNRVPFLTLFTVYVAQADLDAGIAIAVVPPLDAQDRPMLPFTGDSGPIRVRNNNGDFIRVTSDGGTGQAFLGARTKDVADNTTDDEDNPVTKAPLEVGQLLGALPADVAAGDLQGNITSGLIVAPGVNLGRFLYGGTVTGAVDAGGSIDQFYAGWLLTGNAAGAISAGNVTAAIEDNFNVAGDIRNLIVTDSIGSNNAGGLEPQYVTGFDMNVGGTVGQIVTRDSFAGSATVEHVDGIPTTIGRGQTEIEVRVRDNPALFDAGILGSTVPFHNDTFNTPQFLGTIASTTLGQAEVILLDGVIQDVDPLFDEVDYYAVGLLAGQTVTAQVESLFPVLQLGVFDPDGRLVYSDHSNVDPAEVQYQPFRFTADRPGVYRFVVGGTNDPDFNGGSPTVGVNPYTMTIRGLGDVALGALSAANNILAAGHAGDPAVGVQRGDLGTSSAGAQNLSPGGITYGLPAGNLRALTATDIGIVAMPAGDPRVNVPNGSVGLVRATGGSLFFNSPVPGSELILPPTIGGDFQVVDGPAATVLTKLITAKSIGVIRAGNMATLPNTILSIDDDRSGDDGRLDLLDVAGDLGTLNTGGPVIFTGIRSNIRYMRVGGTTFRDSFFGGGTVEPTLYAPGEAPTLTDDSGTNVKLDPGPGTLNGDGTFSNIPSITALAYPIRAGGFAIIDVTSSDTVTVTASGDTDFAERTAEIGRINVQGTGTELIPLVNGVDRFLTGRLGEEFPFDGLNELGSRSPLGFEGLPTSIPFNPDLIDPRLDPLALEINGEVRVDVLEIVGGNFTRIRNTTPRGEIVSVTAGTIGRLESEGTIGLPMSSTGAEVNPMRVTASAFPFNQQHYSINSASIGEIHADRGIGNINVTGSIGLIDAEPDDDVPDLHQGINGPIFAGGPNARIFFTDVGDGILSAGTGDLGRAGLYAEGRIGQVRGRDATIRGEIVSQTAIDGVTLRNGSIVNADILVIGILASAREQIAARTGAPDPTEPITRPVFELGPITVNGNGGIIGNLIIGPDVDRIVVNGGFGVFDSVYDPTGASQVVAGITADGYGIRGVSSLGGAIFRKLVATGDGSSASTERYNSDVRLSETFEFDPFFGFQPNRLTDLHRYLGTSKAQPEITGVTDTGAIEDISIVGSRDLLEVRANQIRSTAPEQIPSVISFSNEIRLLETRDIINGLALTAGRIKTFKPGSDVFNTALTVAGPIKSLTIKGSLAGNSSVTTQGGAGTISKLTVRDDLEGDITASGSIKTLAVGRDFTGNVTAFSRRGTALSKLTVGRNFVAGNLNITGNVGTIQTKGSFGSTGDTLNVTGTLKTLKTGGPLFSNVNVARTAKTIDIGGPIVSGSTVSIGDTLSSLRIRGDLEAGAVIQAEAIRKRLIEGQELGQIIITG